MVTEADNKTHSLIKHGGWIGLFAVLYHDYYLLTHNIQVNIKDLAMSIGIVLGACGAGIAVSAASGSEHKDEGDHDSSN